LSASKNNLSKPMKTDLNYVKKLIKIIDTCDISEIEIDEGETKIRVVKNKPQSNESPQIISYTPAQIPVMPSQPAAPASEPLRPKEEEKAEEKEPSKNLIEVRSPIVGTFYRAPSPNADPYVQVGQRVTSGTVLCIIEAMKLMNEIESEVEGKIAKILVENAQPVEYNQVLFLVEPA
jgi:acetyl-CoA carboxylase biotin carboxyl carrier protein